MRLHHTSPSRHVLCVIVDFHFVRWGWFVFCYLGVNHLSAMITLWVVNVRVKPLFLVRAVGVRDGLAVGGAAEEAAGVRAAVI